MKIICSLVVLFGFIGQALAGGINKDSLIVSNGTPYTIEIFREGKPWPQQGGLNQTNSVMIAPEGGVLVITNCPGRFNIDFRAVEIVPFGCLVSELTVGSTRWPINMTTNTGPQLIAVKGRDLRYVHPR